MLDINADALDRSDFRLVSAEVASIRERWLLRALDKSQKRADHYRSLEREAACYIESPIAMRTHFTGLAPYTGWQGVGLALNEVLDERDALRLAVHKDASAGEIAAQLAENIAGTIDRTSDISEDVARDLIRVVTAALTPVLMARGGPAT